MDALDREHATRIYRLHRRKGMLESVQLLLSYRPLSFLPYLLLPRYHVYTSFIYSHVLP
jgi:hypothetical protein